MIYTCSSCSRTLEFGEEISFCPFCGNAYQKKEQAVAVTKIVIGSDSERTIQEKYWNYTRKAVHAALDNLKESLPRFSEKRDKKIVCDEKTCEQYKTERLGVCALSELAYCTSTVEFQAKLQHILADVEKKYRVSGELVELGNKYTKENRRISAERKLAIESGEWSIEEIEDEYSVDIDAEEAFVQDFCSELAENLGNMAPDRLQPELDYDPDSTDWLEDESNEDESNENESNKKCLAPFQGYAALWKEIQASASAVISALECNGLFVLTLIHGGIEESFDPNRCAKDLRKLRDEDYDPLFGESPECFIRTFFDGLANLMNYINDLPNYREIMEQSPEQKLLDMKNELDEIKLDSLKQLIHSWSDILSRELDRLYQSQSENMMDVCSGIEKMGERLNQPNKSPKTNY